MFLVLAARKRVHHLTRWAWATMRYDRYAPECYYKDDDGRDLWSAAPVWLSVVAILSSRMYLPFSRTGRAVLV